MITFSSPIQINIGTQTVTLTAVDYVTTDNPANKTVSVKFDLDQHHKGTESHRLTVWHGEEYTAAGDYTQSELDNRVISILASNPAQVLSTLLTEPIKVVNSVVSYSIPLSAVPHNTTTTLHSA